MSSGARDPDAGSPARRGLDPEAPPVPRWAKEVARVLDDWLKIPGTDRGVGLDALLGFLVPGGGDAITAVGAASLLVLAIKRGVPKTILFRMIGNLGVDAVFGSVPVLGDLFDVAFRANRRNLELLEKHQRHGQPPGVGDYAILALGFLVVAIGVALPIALGVFLGLRFARLAGGS
jgi:hypothetical protein